MSVSELVMNHKRMGSVVFPSVDYRTSVDDQTNCAVAKEKVDPISDSDVFGN